MIYNGSYRFLGDAIPQDVSVVDGAGNQLTGFDSSRPANSTLVSVAQSAVDVILKASNPARRQIVIKNQSSKVLFLNLVAQVATPTLHSLPLGPGGIYESPLGGYTGDIHGIWSAAGTGSASITEITT